MSVAEFIDECLPTLVRESLIGRQSWKVLLATCKEFDDDLFGVCTTGRPGIEITVRSGKDAYRCEDVQGRGIGPVDQGALATMEHYDLAIVYLGLREFEQACRFALHLRRSGRATRVVVITCACDPEEKSSGLDSLIATGRITCVIHTKQCGGQIDFRDILRALPPAWEAIQSA